MISKEPKMVVRDLIDREFDGTNTDYAGEIEVITGWYGENSVGPKVTVTNTDEFVIGGGDTEISAGPGRKVQVRAGDLLINCWSGTREDLSGAASDGSDINPKDMSWQIRREVGDILTDFSPSEFHSLAPGTIRDQPEPDHPRGFVFRKEIMTRYTYIT